MFIGSCSLCWKSKQLVGHRKYSLKPPTKQFRSGSQENDFDDLNRHEETHSVGQRARELRRNQPSHVFLHRPTHCFPSARGAPRKESIKTIQANVKTSNCEHAKTSIAFFGKRSMITVSTRERDPCSFRTLPSFGTVWNSKEKIMGLANSQKELVGIEIGSFLSQRSLDYSGLKPKPQEKIRRWILH